MKQVPIRLSIIIFLIAITVCCSSGNNKSSSQDPNDEYFQEHTVDVDMLTPEQLQSRIKMNNIALEHIQEILESDETNPEERHEAMLTRINILKERDAYLEALEKKKKFSTIVEEY